MDCVRASTSSSRAVLLGLAERSARGPPAALGSARLVGTGAGGVLERGAQDCHGCPAQNGEGLVVVQAADVLRAARSRKRSSGPPGHRRVLESTVVAARTLMIVHDVCGSVAQRSGTFEASRITLRSRTSPDGRERGQRDGRSGVRQGPIEGLSLAVPGGLRGRVAVSILTERPESRSVIRWPYRGARHAASPPPDDMDRQDQLH